MSNIEQLKSEIIELGKAKGYELTNDEEIYEFLDDSIKTVDTLIVGSRRWWTDTVDIKSIGNSYIGIQSAQTTGDDSPHDKGWEPTYELYEYAQVEKTIITYELVMGKS